MKIKLTYYGRGLEYNSYDTPQCRGGYADCEWIGKNPPLRVFDEKGDPITTPYAEFEAEKIASPDEYNGFFYRVISTKKIVNTMNTIKVIPLGDGTGIEVNPFAEIEISGQFNPKINTDWERFEAEHPPLPLLLTGRPFMEKGVVVECEKVFQGQTAINGKPISNWFFLTYNSEALTPEEWEMQGYIIRPVYSIITENNFNGDVMIDALESRKTEPIKPTVEEMAEKKFPMGYVDATSIDAVKRAAVNQKQQAAFISGYTTAEADFKKANVWNAKLKSHLIAGYIDLENIDDAYVEGISLLIDKVVELVEADFKKRVVELVENEDCEPSDNYTQGVHDICKSILTKL